MTTNAILQNSSLLFESGGITQVRVEASADTFTLTGDASADVAITGVRTPQSSTDATNKLYVDTATELNASNLSAHIALLSSWEEYSSNVDTTEIVRQPDDSSSDLVTPGGEFTSVNVTALGTYRLTFNSQYSISTGACVCKQALDDLIVELADNTSTAHGPEYGASTLTPGYYLNGGATTHTGQLILDGDGIFIIKSVGAHAIAVNSTTILHNGAKSSNVFWVITGAISIAAGCSLIGNYISIMGLISAGAGLGLDGRFLTTGGAITLADITGTAPTES
jgi:hypothetical protein